MASKLQGLLGKGLQLIGDLVSDDFVLTRGASVLEFSATVRPVAATDLPQTMATRDLGSVVHLQAERSVFADFGRPAMGEVLKNAAATHSYRIIGFPSVDSADFYFPMLCEVSDG